jgi:hypothetical protein
MLIVLAALGVIIVFVICFLSVQWWIAHSANTQSNESMRVRRTLENGARTLGGSDFLRDYPPRAESERPKQDR